MRIRFPAHSVCASFVLILLASVWSSLSATPAPPPVLCVDDVDCVESAPIPDGNDGSGSGGSYTLASIGSVPFAYSTPVPPTITSEVTVTPATIAANKVNGRRIVLSPGNYGNQNFGSQDQEIVFTPGANMGVLTIGSSAKRLVFRGQTPRVGSIGYIYLSSPQSEDILFDGVRQYHVSGFAEERNYFSGLRVAVINSDLTARRMAIWSVGARDLIFANNILRNDPTLASGSADATVRFHSLNRLVFVDNRVVNGTFTPDIKHTFRIHSGSTSQPATDNCYVARNQFEGAGNQIAPADGTGGWNNNSGIVNVWFENNRHYIVSFLDLLGYDAAAGSANWVQVFRVRNNQVFGSAPNNWPPQALPAWVIQNNTVNSYQTPPPWNFK